MSDYLDRPRRSFNMIRRQRALSLDLSFFDGFVHHPPQSRAGRRAAMHVMSGGGCQESEWRATQRWFALRASGLSHSNALFLHEGGLWYVD